MNNFDPTKPVRTRDGKMARILCTDASVDGCPIVALIKSEIGDRLETFRGNGHWASPMLEGGRAWSNVESPNDLINVPKTHKLSAGVWVYPNGMFYFSRDGSADDQINRVGAVAYKQVDFEVTEGEGL